MARTNIIPAARVQAWRKKLIPQHLTASVWDQFSNQFTANIPIPKQSEKPIPSAVVMKVTDDFKNGAFRTTMISLRQGSVTVVGGPNPAAGRENRNTMLEVGIFYNVQRIPQIMTDQSVEGDVGEFYRIAEQAAGMVTTGFVKEYDYDHQRASVEGADIFLTDPAYWQDSEKGSNIDNPLSVVLHPNTYIWINGALVLNTWSATNATAMSNLEVQIALLDSADTFSIQLLDAIQFIASNKINSLPGMQGQAEILWVLKMSQVQWYQMMTSSAAGSVIDRFKYTDTTIGKVVTGYMGVYKNMMVVVDARAPLVNLDTAAVAFQYITPQTVSQTLTRVVPNGTVGTGEIAMLYGNGALGQAIKEELNFENKLSEDYGFEQSLCGVVKRGVRRVDLDATDAATAARVNESSFLVITASSVVAGGF